VLALRRLVERRAARWEAHQFVVEGPRLLGEALASGAEIETVYLDTADATAEHRDLAERCASTGARTTVLQPGVLARACDAVTPQPIAGVVSMVDVALGALQGRDLRPAVVCVGLQDPGNAGTVLRSAAASGAGAVVFCAGSVDLYSPKTVRSSAGAIFHVPVVAGLEADEIFDELAHWGLRLVGTASAGGDDYLDVDLVAPAALVFGSESSGLPAGLEVRLDQRVTIPMSAGVESINVAMAASVLCFEAARQRRLLELGRLQGT
jgi:TrmH family RNA methyltransferase